MILAFDFLKMCPGDVCVLVGGNVWLRDMARRHFLSDCKGMETVPCKPADFHDAAAEGSLFGGRIIMIDPADGMEKAVARFKKPDNWPHRVLLLASKWKGGLWEGTDHLVDCDTPPPARLASWCQSMARENGMEMDNDAAMTLAKVPGEFIGNEMEKLICYVKGTGKITRQDIETLTTSKTEAKAWQIISAIADGSPEEAFSVCDDLFAASDDHRETAFAVWGILSAHLRKLVKAVRLRKVGKSPEEALNGAGIETWRAGEAARAIGVLKKKLNGVLDWLLEAEAGMKGSGRLAGVQPKVICEMLLGKLAAG